VTTKSLRETQAFFATRAAGWEERFPDDEPRYEQAVREFAPPAGGRVLDVGCGTGRAIPFLRRVIGPEGSLVAVDVTPEMLAEAQRRGRDQVAHLLQADGEAPPFRDASFDAILAAGFLPHLPDPERGLAELARIARPGARLAIFHPIGRATLAARHGGTPSDDEVIAPVRLRPLLAASGWHAESIDDGAERYLALAVRV